MIICGYHFERLDCAGHSTHFKGIFKCPDVHEASKELYKMDMSSGFQVQNFKEAEFFDTVSSLAWGVDSNGHTLKNYRKDTKEKFVKKWKN